MSEATPHTTRQWKRARSKAKQAQTAPLPEPEEKDHSLVVRSVGPMNRCKSLTLTLSEPAEGEECSIGMEPIAAYRLPFIQFDAAPREDMPALTKASLPCGHAFNALALLYHFAKNSMTCPCCRAGHEKVQMGELSIPSHVRKAFSQHLESVRIDETREQIASDAIAATRALEQEVSMGAPLPMTRVVLLLYAYDSVDSTLERLVLELPLTSSLSQGDLAFASYGYFLHQLNLNLRLLSIRPRAFELSVGLASFLHGPLPLFRTVRFPAEGAGRRVVFASGRGSAADSMAIEVETSLGQDNYQVFTLLRWTVSVAMFTSLLLSATQYASDEIFAAV
jgi:hypothetical protein